MEPRPLVLKNWYPEDIFTPLTKEELRRVNEVLQKELGFPLDRLSAQVGRELFEGWSRDILEMKAYLKNRVMEFMDSYLVPDPTEVIKIIDESIQDERKERA